MSGKIREASGSRRQGGKKMGEAAKSPRNSAIELCRILLMFGIVVLHATYVSKGAGSFHWLNTGT